MHETKIFRFITIDNTNPSFIYNVHEFDFAMVSDAGSENMSSVLQIFLLVEKLVRIYSEEAKQENGADSEQCKALENELEVSG